MAPDRASFFSRIDQHDLFDEADQNKCKFCLRADYNGPWQGLNRLLRSGSHTFGKKQHCVAIYFPVTLSRVI